MSEWWTYRPADFLMFSPRIYERLFEQVNQAWWPLHALLLAAGALALVALWQGRARLALGIGLGLAWLLCGAVFLQPLYQPIFWAVGHALPPLLLLAALLPVLAWRTRTAPSPPKAVRRWAAGLAAWALLLHPLLAWPAWRQAEVLALAPDPTAIATLALLLALPRDGARSGRALVALAWLLALAWCAFSAFMLAAMESPKAWVLLLAAVLAVAARAWMPREPAQPGG